jgi:hypothetical protein
MNNMPSIGTSIAPSQNKLNYFPFFNEAGNILPLKKQYPAYRRHPSRTNMDTPECLPALMPDRGAKLEK